MGKNILTDEIKKRTITRPWCISKMCLGYCISTISLLIYVSKNDMNI